MNRLLIGSAIAIIASIAIGTATHGVQLVRAIAEQKDIGVVEESPLGVHGLTISERKAPIAISGDNVYIVWWSNKTGNDEVNFRASTDGGATFTDKINLSNSSGADSQDVEIAADGDNVIITWWERNQTAEEPVARFSSDNGAIFGPLLRLANNGTLGQAAAEE